jgi:hypothetical protein
MALERNLKMRPSRRSEAVRRSDSIGFLLKIVAVSGDW